MTPQDTRSPFQQQRWIELYNVGSVEIPAFGACEVTDSYRPEKTGGYTPDGGRTVLKVRQAETDNPKLSVINGPCPIPYGESRRVGTMDSPMLAQVAYAGYTAGTDVGIKTGSFKLESGYTGYRIIGDYDAGTDTMRVVKGESNESKIGFQHVSTGTAIPGGASTRVPVLESSGSFLDLDARGWSADASLDQFTCETAGKYRVNIRLEFQIYDAAKVRVVIYHTRAAVTIQAHTYDHTFPMGRQPTHGGSTTSYASDDTTCELWIDAQVGDVLYALVSLPTWDYYYKQTGTPTDPNIQEAVWHVHKLAEASASSQ